MLLIRVVSHFLKLVVLIFTGVNFIPKSFMRSQDVTPPFNKGTVLLYLVGETRHLDQYHFPKTSSFYQDSLWLNSTQDCGDTTELHKQFTEDNSKKTYHS